MSLPARRAAVALALVLAAPVLALVGLNVFLNTGLLALLNRQPERLSMGWDWAWTWDARRVEIRGYTLRAQGPVDQWWLAVDRARLLVDVVSLLQRRFVADAVAAEGVALRYRSRVDAPRPPGAPPSTYAEGRTAPIPGLSNPPLERPEDLYPPPAAPWLVALDGVEVADIREIWLGDYRFVGVAQAAGELIVLPGASIDLSGVEIEVLEGELLLDDLPVLSDLALEAELSLEGVDPVHDVGVEMFQHLSGTARFLGRVDDLRYVDIFLRGSPWVGIHGGTGLLSASLQVEEGVLGPGTTARAAMRDLEVRVGGYAAVGEGHVELAVEDEARLSLVLDEYAVYQGRGDPLVTGRGFRLGAETPALALHVAPPGFTTVATLPRSQVPSLQRFDHYLPADVGLRVVGGRATVEGRVRIEEDGDQVSGRVLFEATEAHITYAKLPISGALRLEGKVPHGSLDQGRYDIRGSTLALSRVSVDGAPPTWGARLDVHEGTVAAGARTFLTARADIACSDSSPFFRLAVGDRPVEPWIRDMMLLKSLRGEVAASFGQTSLRVDHLRIRTPKAEVHLHLTQEPARLDALLFARLGILGFASRIAGDEYTLQLVDAKRWFHARLAEAGTPEEWTSMRGEVYERRNQPVDARRGIKILGKDIRKLLQGKRKPTDTSP